jgi:hypothetical protein
LCFTCGKPGHQARNCKQSKGKKPWNKSGKAKHLNATWQGYGGNDTSGQLNATFAGTMHGVGEASTSSADPISDSDDTWEMESLTTSEQEEYEKLAQQSPLLKNDKDWLAKHVKEHHDKMREMDRVHDESIKELNAYYKGKNDALDALRDAFFPTQEVKDQQELKEIEAWKKLDHLHIGYHNEGPPKDREDPISREELARRKKLDEVLVMSEADLRPMTRFEELTKEQESTIPGYENGNMAETDHPWHQSLLWEQCYTNSCQTHLESKKKHSHFPHARIPVYAERHDVARRAERRRSIEGHAAFIQEQQSKN